MLFRELVGRIGAKLTSVEDALKSSNIVILAVPKDFYEKQPLHLLEGKVIVDVSNRNSIYRKDEVSQAEYLQSLLPRSAVVKAFNVLSAYALETGGIQGKVFLSIFFFFYLFLLWITGFVDKRQLSLFWVGQYQRLSSQLFSLVHATYVKKAADVWVSVLFLSIIFGRWFIE